MDFALTDEQQLIRATAREFTDNEIVDRARENDRNHHFDVDLVRKIADQGYLGAIVPREYGGAGLTAMRGRQWRSAHPAGVVLFAVTGAVLSGAARLGLTEASPRFLGRGIRTAPDRCPC